ncbi:hypothetical protein AMECASPLE_034410 [Ameca splendens]|uniref:Uncharacterized protein n=1 Tax=Ameca splendens TaxID=208324 RepID=A0ABV0Z605_9TELE
MFFDRHLLKHQKDKRKVTFLYFIQPSCYLFCLALSRSLNELQTYLAEENTVSFCGCSDFMSHTSTTYNSSFGSPSLNNNVHTEECWDCDLVAISLTEILIERFDF